MTGLEDSSVGPLGLELFEVGHDVCPSLYGFERAPFSDDPIDAMIVRLGGDRIDDLGVVAHPDEGGPVPGAMQGTDEAIIEPCAASEAVASPIEGKTREQDHIELCWFHHCEPGLGHTDAVSACFKIVGQICDGDGRHGFGGPVDAREADFFARSEGGGDKGVEREFCGECGVGEDGGGRNEAFVAQDLIADRIAHIIVVLG